MAETQEDMSVDEILSSIKDILVNDGKPLASPETESKEQPEKENSPLVNESSELPSLNEVPDLKELNLNNTQQQDDVIELSQDMVIPSEENKSSNETQEEMINLEEELAGIDLTPQIIDDKGDEDPLDLRAFPDANEPVSEVDLPQHSWDTSSDPYDQPLGETTEVTPETASEPVLAPATSTDFGVTGEYVIPSIENKEDAEEEASSVSDDVADVSAGIIDNFAKMLEHPDVQREEPQTISKPSVDSVSASVADMNLEDMVKNALQKQVAEMVAQAQSKINLDNIVAQEVSKMIASWLNANLPSVVENIVKKEIERVMVKVGR